MARRLLCRRRRGLRRGRSDAVQEQSAGAVPLREASEGREGVRREDEELQGVAGSEAEKEVTLYTLLLIILIVVVILFVARRL